MSDLKITGTITHIGETVQISEKFKKRDLVITFKSGEYDNDAAFQLSQDRTALGDTLAEGQEVEVHFNIRSREYNGKYYTNLDAWRVVATQQAPQPQAQASVPTAPAVAEGSIDDLPF